MRETEGGREGERKGGRERENNTCMYMYMYYDFVYSFRMLLIYFLVIMWLILGR